MTEADKELLANNLALHIEQQMTYAALLQHDACSNWRELDSKIIKKLLDGMKPWLWKETVKLKKQRPTEFGWITTSKKDWYAAYDEARARVEKKTWSATIDEAIILDEALSLAREAARKKLK